MAQLLEVVLQKDLKIMHVGNNKFRMNYSACIRMLPSEQQRSSHTLSVVAFWNVPSSCYYDGVFLKFHQHEILLLVVNRREGRQAKSKVSIVRTFEMFIATDGIWNIPGAEQERKKVLYAPSSSSLFLRSRLTTISTFYYTLSPDQSHIFIL